MMNKAEGLLTIVGRLNDKRKTEYFTYNPEHHWFWAEVDGQLPLKRLKIEHQAALDFLEWERGREPGEIVGALDERQEELLQRAQDVRRANKADEFGIHLLTIEEARGWS